MDTYDVVIAGAGPTGLVLAIDLGQRGIRTLLVEKDADTKPFPKMDRSNARTLEIFRRLGFADEARAVGYPAEASMDVLLVRNLAEAPLEVLHYPTVAEHRDLIARTRDGSEPLEPYQLVSQNDLEPVLVRVASGLPSVTVRFGCELVDFAQDADGVVVTLADSTVTTSQARGKYLIACDGGVSPIRKALGIPLNGRAALLEQTQITFRSDDLYEKLPHGRGRHFYIADAAGASVIVQGSRRQFTLNLTAGNSLDPAEAIRSRIPLDFDFEVENVRNWKLHLLVADRFREGRVLLAGDAVHLVIPTGGLGMNTGIGDAIDLGWKLAGTLAGWGGTGLLDSYEAERRPIALKNMGASGWSAEGMFLWRQQWTPDVLADTTDGAAARTTLAEAFERHQRRVHEMVGVELGYSYAGGPLVAHEDGNVPEWDVVRYTPSAAPGNRIPHMWLADGRALQDAMGRDFTLLDLTGHEDTASVEAGFAAADVPLDTLHLDEPGLRSVYGARFLLVRPDLHVFWRGDTLPDPAALAVAASGRGLGPFAGTPDPGGAA